LQLTGPYLRGFGEHRRAKIGPQRSERMRAEQGQKRAHGHQVAVFVGRMLGAVLIPRLIPTIRTARPEDKVRIIMEQIS